MTSRLVALLVICCFLSTSTAAVAGAPLHAVPQADLHSMVVSSHEQVAAARASVHALLDRSDVTGQVRKLGLSPDRVKAQVAALSASEIVALHDQLMADDMQQVPAGLSSGAIVAIVLGGIAASILLIVLANEAVDDEYYYW